MDVSRLHRTRQSASGDRAECRAIPDEEILFPAVQSDPVHPREPDAVARGEAADHAWPTIRGTFDQVAGALPVDRQPFVNGSQDLRKRHRSRGAHSPNGAMIHLYCRGCHGGVPCGVPGNDAAHMG